MRIYFLFCCAMLFAVISCKKESPVIPPEKPGVDTTSHAFTWQVYVLGENTGYSSHLYDVAIINDTMVWATGAVYLRDSLGDADPEPYGLAKWDGQRWKFEKRYLISGGGGHYYASGFRTILVFSPTDIYICSAASLLHWSGEYWVEKAFFMTSTPWNGQVTKMWGNSGNSIYLSGLNGSLYHYSGDGTWRKIPTGITSNIMDVEGYSEPATHQEVVYCAATSFFEGGRPKLLRITDAIHVDSVDWQPQKLVETIWSEHGDTLYAGGDGLFKRTAGEWHQIASDYYIYNVRGVAKNDIVAVGDGCYITHFNGTNWHVYTELITPNCGFAGVAIKGNMIVAVGSSSTNAVVAIGRR